MAVPKRRLSQARRDRRRANWKLEAPGLVIAPETKEVKLPHHVSPDGYYKGRYVFKKKAAEAAE